MTVQIRPSIFREYDIRGIAGKDCDRPNSPSAWVRP